MRRPTVRRQQPGVALFPFLAVLICTMGSLIVLLVLVVQQARAGAVRPLAEKPTVPAIDPTELQRMREQEEDLQWRAELLQQQRDEYAQDLLNKRDELAHLENHIRQLEDQAKRLVTQAEEFQRAGKNRLADRDSALKQLAEMEQEIAEKKVELEKSQKEVLRRRPAYAIVPYDGPNGTSRRPMYIECTEAGIVLQPEGVVLKAEDFQGPLGPGNPLDAALRATREHLKRRGLQTEPYPLVIVRPDGAIAFGACRGAMKHWESEFGYELIDQDAVIKYQAADHELATLQQRAIEAARLRQEALMAAMPRRFMGGEAKLTSFRAADNQVGIHEGEGRGAGSAPGRAFNGGLPGGGTGGTGMGTGPRGATGAGGSGTSGIASGYGQRPGTDAGQPGSRTTTGASGSPGTNGQNSGGASGQPGSGETADSGGNSSSGSSSGSGQTAGGQRGSAGRAGGTPGGNSAQGSASSQSGASGTSGSSGGSPASSFSPSSSTGSEGSSPQLNVQGGDGGPSSAFNPQLEKARKKIKSRGENWGLPITSAKATGITRPIRVVCADDQIVLYPERGDNRTPLIVPINDDLTENLDAVVANVWRHMDGWGLAVAGGYWKPLLSVDVQPGGEQRFEELQQLLRGSGIEVEKR